MNTSETATATVLTAATTTSSAGSVTIPVSGPLAAVLDIPAGSVRLVASDRADATVRVLPADAEKSRDVKAAQQIQIRHDDGVLRVEAAPAKHKVLGNSGSVAVTVELPTGSRVEVKTGLAEVKSVGALGEVTVESAAGSIRLEETAAAQLILQSGDISVERLGGSAELSTLSGDISVGEAQRGTLVLRTQSGSLSVGVARGVSATLDAGTGHGRVHNSLQNAVGGPADVNIHATTSNGDITARSL
jgi:DUF4097 and DUF4098 domain-containing protein YvlB